MQRVDEALDRIVDSPYAYQIVYRQLCRAVLHQFPFAIFYRPSDDEIQVFAVIIPVVIRRGYDHASFVKADATH